MKVLYKTPIGGDGLEASAVVDSGSLQVRLSFPVAKIVAPLKEKLVKPIADKIKALIPGNFEDALVDKASNELVDYGVKLLTEENA